MGIGEKPALLMRPLKLRNRNVLKIKKMDNFEK